MDFDFSAEQYALRDEARRFLEKECSSAHVREFLDDASGWSLSLWKQMSALGWTALPFPERFGGLGHSFLDVTLLLGELGRVLAPVPYLSSAGAAGQVILVHGNDEQRERWIPTLASGERVAVLAVAEADARFDEDGVSAVALHDGHWKLLGEKRYVFDAPAADLFVVAARASQGTRWFVAEEASRVTAQRAFDRTRTIGTLTFDEVPTEPLAEPTLEPGLSFAVVALCAEMVGSAQKVLDMSVEYAKQREQFGRPIGSFQAIKHKLAEMATALEAARAATYYACWAVSTGADDAPIAASIAKSYCSDALAHVAAEGVQIHGGIGFTWEHDMHLYLKRLKTAQAMFGDAAFHRERIARLAGL